MRKVGIATTATVGALVVAVFVASALFADPALGSGTRNARKVPVNYYAHRVLTLTNQQRRLHGCRPLYWQNQLRASAQTHTNRMASRGLLSHLLANELGLVARILRTGYHPWHILAENIAVGYQTPSAVVKAWMNSPDHRRNILNCQLHDLGVGVTTTRDGTLWWTQDFGVH